MLALQSYLHILQYNVTYMFTKSIMINLQFFQMSGLDFCSSTCMLVSLVLTWEFSCDEVVNRLVMQRVLNGITIKLKLRVE